MGDVSPDRPAGRVRLSAGDGVTHACFGFTPEECRQLFRVSRLFYRASSDPGSGGRHQHESGPDRDAASPDANTNTDTHADTVADRVRSLAGHRGNVPVARAPQHPDADDARLPGGSDARVPMDGDADGYSGFESFEYDFWIGE